MDLFKQAAGMVDMGANMKDNDPAVLSSMRRLLSITELVVDEFSSMICDIYMYPMSMLNTPLKDLKALEIYIVYLLSDDPDLNTKVKQIKEFAETAYADEFDEADYIKIYVSDKPAFTRGSIMLYSAFGCPNLEEFVDSDYKALYKLCEAGYKVYLSTSFMYEKIRSLILLCPTMELYTKALRGLFIEGSYSMTIFDLVKKKQPGVVYLPTMVELNYKLPYTLVTVESFNEQRISDS